VESIRLEKAVEKAKMFPSKVASFRMRKKREGRRQAIKAELEDTDSTVEFIPKVWAVYPYSSFTAHRQSSG
jgi:hypothetical protein